MGQMTVGVLYGAKLPEGMWAYEDEAEDGGILRRFESEAMFVDRTKPDHYQTYWKLRREIVPATAYENNLIGYWVALDRGGDAYGVPGFHTRKLHEISGAYVEEIKEACLRWEFFAEWARQRGVGLPDPDLWITETEVA